MKKEIEEIEEIRESLRAIDMLSKMTSTKEPFGLFNVHFWSDKTGDSLLHCEIRSVDSVLSHGQGETLHQAVYNCYHNMGHYN
ncbi:MAG: hypothetical protein WCQ96_02920 [Patescibacteria group bacterium]